MLKLEFRPRAHLDRESIAIYLGVDCKNPKAALATIQHIDSVIANVREFPDSGRCIDMEELQNHDYRVAIAGKYKIYYRHDAETLVVYRILHERMDIAPASLVEL